MEDVGQWVKWEPVLILVQEGSPLAPFMEAPIVEENSATPAQEDSAIVEDDVMVE